MGMPKNIAAIDLMVGMEGVRRIRQFRKKPGRKALTCSPSASTPRVAINERECLGYSQRSGDLHAPDAASGSTSSKASSGASPGKAGARLSLKLRTPSAKSGQVKDWGRSSSERS